MKYPKLTFRSVIFVALIILSAIPAIILWSYSYENFCRFFLSSIGKADKLIEFQGRFLVRSKFDLLRVISICIPVAATVLFFLVERFDTILKQTAKDIYPSIKQNLKCYIDFINGLSFEKKITSLILFGFVAVTRVYYMLKMPVAYDEAWTYLNFTQNGFLVSAAYYPAPNNHILHSLLTNLTFYLPFDATTNLRIPALIVGLLSVFLFWLFTAKAFSWKTSIITTAIFSSFFPAIYYGYNSRGYALTLFAFVLGGLCTIRLVSKNGSVSTWFLWTISNMIGLYAVPTYLYNFVSTGLIILFSGIYYRDLARIKTLIINGCAVLFFVSILYLPVILIGSVESVVSSKFVRSTDRMRVMEELFLPNTKMAFEYLFSFEFGWLMILMLIVLNYLVFPKKWLVNVVVFLMAAPIFLQLVHGVIFPERAWLFQIAAISLLFGMIIYSIELKKNISDLIAIPASMVILIFGVLNFNQQIKFYEQLGFNSEILSQTIRQNNVGKVYVNYDLNEIYTQYFSAINNRKYDVYCAHLKGELDQSELSAYDLIVIRNGTRDDIKLDNYEILTENPDFTAYLRKP